MHYRQSEDRVRGDLHNEDRSHAAARRRPRESQAHARQRNNVSPATPRKLILPYLLALLAWCGSLQLAALQLAASVEVRCGQGAVLQVDVLYLGGGFSMTPRASARYPLFLIFFCGTFFLPFVRRPLFFVIYLKCKDAFFSS